MDGEDYLDRVLRLGGLQKRRRSYINGSHINNSAGVDVTTTASKSHDQAESGHRNHYAACGNHEEAQSSHRNDYAASAGDHDKAESRHRNHHSGVRVGDYEEAGMDAAATAEIGRGNGDEQLGEGMNVVVADAEIRPEVQQAVITQEGQEMRRHLVHWVDTDPYGRIQMHKRPRPGPKKTSNTYKGVAEYRRNSKWEAYIWLHDDEKLKVMGVFKRPRVQIRAGEKQRNQLPLGTWCSPEKAARTYDRAVLKLRKETENFHPRMYVHELHKYWDMEIVEFFERLRADTLGLDDEAEERRMENARRVGAAAAEGNEIEVEERTEVDLEDEKMKEAEEDLDLAKRGTHLSEHTEDYYSELEREATETLMTFRTHFDRNQSPKMDLVDLSNSPTPLPILPSANLPHTNSVSRIRTNSGLQSP